MLFGCSRHKTPDAPAVPLGPVSGKPHVPYTYTIAAAEANNDWLSYRIDWGDGMTSQWSCYVLGGVERRFTHEWESLGSYAVVAQARNEDEQLSAWSESLSVTIQPNRPPTVTDGPVGPRAGAQGVEHEYAVAVVDPDHDHVRVRIDWDDGTISPWTKARSSHETFKLAHTWQNPGHYGIRAQAKDSKGQESAWSPDTQVTICVDTTCWHQQVAVNGATGVPEFYGSNPNGNMGSLGGTFNVTHYPKVGGYVWELPPDSSEVRYEQIDLTGYCGADSVRLEWTCGDGHGGQAAFQFSVNDRVLATCTNPDSFNLIWWHCRVSASLFHWDSPDNCMRLLNPPGSEGTLLVTRMECWIFGAWTIDRTSPAQPAFLDSAGPTRISARKVP